MPDLGDSPVPNLPGIRRAIPKFSRPAIDLTRPEKKEWREVDAYEVEIGDVVFGFGLVAHKLERNDESAIGVRLENVMEEARVFIPGEKIRAFVRVKSD